LPCTTRATHARYCKIEWLIEAELDLEPLYDLLWRLRRQQNVERFAGIRWIRLKQTIETPNKISIVCSRRNVMNWIMRIALACAGCQCKRYAMARPLPFSLQRVFTAFPPPSMGAGQGGG
jgi:hypothetical protein